MKRVKKSENIWEIPKEGKMNVPAVVFASDVLMKDIEKRRYLTDIRYL